MVSWHWPRHRYHCIQPENRPYHSLQYVFPGPMLTLFPEREYAQAQVAKPAERGLRSATGKVSYTWKALPESAPFPRDNPPSLEKIALGKKLFFDTRLSADGSLSCASCHEISVEKGGSDGLRTSIGIDGQQGGRNAPTVLNAAFQQVLFWDGRAASLEEQAKGPLVNPIEMGMPSLERVVENGTKHSRIQKSICTNIPYGTTDYNR